MIPPVSHHDSQLAVAEILPVDGPVRQMQAHPKHEVTLHVTNGIVYLVLEDDELVLTPGDAATIPARAAHRFFNAGDEDAQITATYERLPSTRDRASLAGGSVALAAAGCR